MSDNPEMTPARVRVLLEAYGADPRRWPVGERNAAVRMIAASPPLQALQAEAAALDAALGNDVDPEPRPDLVAAVLAARPRPRQRLVRFAASLAACAVLGLAFGAGASRLVPMNPLAAPNPPATASNTDIVVADAAPVPVPNLAPSPAPAATPALTDAEMEALLMAALVGDVEQMLEQEQL